MRANSETSSASVDRESPQREPHPQRDDHPTEGLRDQGAAFYAIKGAIDAGHSERAKMLFCAALAASKDKPDSSMGRGGPKDSGVSSQCHSSGADLKDAARYRWLRANFNKPALSLENFPEPSTVEELDTAIDAAMSADVRSDFVSPVSSPDQTLPAPSAVAQWQPIESAPHSMEDMLIIDAGGYICVGWRRKVGVSQGWYGPGGEVREPTHWMPLPEPPKDDVRSQAKETP